MAGKFIEILNPGYSTLWTRDLLYTPGSGEASDLNVFNPLGARPLVEGEWLEMETTSSGRKFTRGGNNAMAVPATPDGEGTVPAFLYFMEEGRFDAQATKRAHGIMGPSMFEFRTKLIDTTGLSVNDAVAVFDWDGLASAFGLVRRVLAKRTAGYVIGRVTRIFGTGDASVLYMPGTSA